MIIKIRIKTPKGQAKATDKKIRNWLLPRGVTPLIETNKEDNQIIWVVDVDSRKAVKISRNVGRFSGFVSSILDSKMFRKQARKRVGQEGLDELEEMLYKHTTCEIIHE